MKAPILLLTWLILVLVYFFTGNNSVPVQILFKLLPEVVLLAGIAANRSRIERKTFWAVSLALLFSMLGDAAGEMKIGRFTDIAFICQIGLFVVAQILYTCSFCFNIDLKSRPSGATLALKAVPLAIIVAYLGFIGYKVLPAMGGGAFLAAGILYISALLGTGTTSVLQKRPQQFLYIIGAMIFIVSDSVIALNSFVLEQPLPHSHLLIMGTYFIAQLLLNYKLITQ